MTKPIIWEKNLSMSCSKCGDKKCYWHPFDLNIYVQDLIVFSKTHKDCKNASH